MRNALLLVLFLGFMSGASAEGLPAAPISAGSEERIITAWEYQNDAFTEDLTAYPVGSIERGMILTLYLDEAFKEAGYSFDKTFHLWLSKLGPAVLAYPELHQFGVRLGFVEAMIYLTERGPQARQSLLSLDVYSQATADMTYALMTAPKQQEMDDYLYDPTSGSVKADSYEACMEPDSVDCD